MTETSPSAIKRELAVDQQSPTATHRSLSHEQLIAVKRLEALQDEGILPENAVATNISEDDVKALIKEVHSGSLPIEDNGLNTQILLPPSSVPPEKKLRRIVNFRCLEQPRWALSLVFQTPICHLMRWWYWVCRYPVR